MITPTVITISGFRWIAFDLYILYLLILIVEDKGAFHRELKENGSDFTTLQYTRRIAEFSFFQNKKILYV